MEMVRCKVQQSYQFKLRNIDNVIDNVNDNDSDSSDSKCGPDAANVDIANDLPCRFKLSMTMATVGNNVQVLECIHTYTKQRHQK